jgi:hypothetical protein
VNFAPEPVSISPDETYLLCQAKQVAHINAVFLYRRVRGLRYRQVDGDLNSAACAFYEKRYRRKIPVAFFKFTKWQYGSGNLRFRLYGDYGAVLAEGTYDVTALRFR